MSTEIYEGMPDPGPDGGALNIFTLTEAGGETTMCLLVQMPFKERRDMSLASGMESGMQVSYDRLEDVVRGD